MNKAVLFSIRPQHCFDIVQGLKGDEVRKTKPKIDVPFKGYIYCTTGGKLLYKSNRDNAIRLTEWNYRNSLLKNKHTEFNGKVIGEFICNNIDEFTETEIRTRTDEVRKAVMRSCLSVNELLIYKGAKDVLYFINISDLVIYDKPKDLTEFKKVGFLTEENWLAALYPNTHCHYEAWAKKFDITKPPQSYCFVEELQENE